MNLRYKGILSTKTSPSILDQVLMTGSASITISTYDAESAQEGVTLSATATLKEGELVRKFPFSELLSIIIIII